MTSFEASSLGALWLVGRWGGGVTGPSTSQNVGCHSAELVVSIKIASGRSNSRAPPTLHRPPSIALPPSPSAVFFSDRAVKACRGRRTIPVTHKANRNENIVSGGKKESWDKSAEARSARWGVRGSFSSCHPPQRICPGEKKNEGWDEKIASKHNPSLTVHSLCPPGCPHTHPRARTGGKWYP